MKREHHTFSKCLPIIGCLFVCSVFVLVSCSEVLAPVVWQRNTETWNYSADAPVYELSQDTETLRIESSEPVEIFFARMNPGNYVIDGLKTRYVTNLPARSALSSDSIPGLSYIEYADENAGSDQLEFIRRDFKPAQDFVPQFNGKAASVRSVLDEPQRFVVPITPVVDSTTKKIWIDVAAGTPGCVQSGTSFLLEKNATLRAIGDNCYVWVVDDYYVSVNPTAAKVSKAEAAAIQAKFDTMYSLIRHIFGDESDYMVVNNANAEGISSVSDTGRIVNIVIYDIDGDYKANQNSGTFGYFWSKDYFARSFSENIPYAQTNEGKYFYIDSYFTNIQPEMVYSVLAHEFQHMINFGVKWLTPKALGSGSGANSSVWYNEMLSMLCEDMMQSRLGITDEKSPKSRLSQFCAMYPLSGITDWLPGDKVLQSYANAYAFGAYLARNYGGPDFISKIAKNNSVDQVSISAALGSQGYEETFDTVFKKYVQALVFTDPPSRVPSFNKSAVISSAFNGYGYLMTPINIFNYKWKDSLNNTWSGPALYDGGNGGRITLRPYGFTLHAIGYTDLSGTVPITFSEPISASEKIYILVRPRT